MASEIPCRKYGCSNVQFTHHDGSLLHSSPRTRGGDIIRYLSVPANRYIRYFTGHTDRVVSISRSPSDDTFISGGIDGAVRLWDLKQTAPTGSLSLRGSAAVAYDPKGGVAFLSVFTLSVPGLCFAVTSVTGWLRLYDVRLQSRGPFTMLRPCTTKSVSISCCLPRPPHFPFFAEVRCCGTSAR